jgi:hypothetical protein
LLAFFQKRQECDRAIWEFKRIVMGGWDFFIDLTKDRSPVFDRTLAPRPHTLTSDIVCEGKLRTWEDANSNTYVLRSAETPRAGFEKTCG